MRVSLLAALAGLVATLPLAPTATARDLPRPILSAAAPRLLPGDAQAASVSARPDSWLVGARPGRLSARIGREMGARHLMPGTGMYRVDRGRAKRFVVALQRAGRYAFSEPDRYAIRHAFPGDPLTGSQWGLGAIGATTLDPPPVLSHSPLIGVMESGFDSTHPDTQGMLLDGYADPAADPEGVAHGTAVASLVGAPANGHGITGVWPGARVTVFTSNGSCGDAVAAIYAALRAGAKVLNMSYGFSDFGCFSHYIATQRAYGGGTLLVSAAGNEFFQGNPADGRPATDPHVITVAAVRPDLQVASFSNANSAVDLSAPGVGVLAAVPPALDPDGTSDGYFGVDGTSFAAPMVAAATAWVAAERPNLDYTQLTDLVRYATRDLGRRGWDRDFGFGLLDLPAALRARAPRPDWLEPNDDIEWISGKHFRPDAPIYTGRTAGLSARLDRLEDPADVYRIVVGGRQAVKITLRPRYGNPQLEVYNGWARTTYGRRGRIARSLRPGRRTEVTWIQNSGRGRRTAWVVAWPASLDAGYRLQIKRARYIP